MNDDRDQDPIENANNWIESPVGYFDDIDWNLVDPMVSDLTIWKLTIDEAVEVAELFSNRRIDYRNGTLTVYGIPTDTWKWFDPWIKSKWPEKWG